MLSKFGAPWPNEKDPIITAKKTWTMDQIKYNNVRQCEKLTTSQDFMSERRLTVITFPIE